LFYLQRACSERAGFSQESATKGGAMKISINIEKHRAGIYSDDLIFSTIIDLVMAIERFYPDYTIPARYIKKEIAKAKRIEYLAKSLVVALQSIQEGK